MDGGTGDPQLPTQEVRAAPEAQPCFDDALHDPAVHPRSDAVRARSGVAQGVRALPAEAVDPLARRLARHTGCAGGTRDRPAGGDSLDDQVTLVDGQTGVRMLHEDPSLRLWLRQPTADRKGPPPVANLCGPFN